MITLPKDIENKIDSLFTVSEDNLEVKKLIRKIWSTSLNVGEAQLARSVLVLSNGNLEKLKEIFLQDFYGDPRDVLMQAEHRLGNPGHYFVPPFDEIEKPE